MNLETALAQLAEPAPPTLASKVAAALDLGDQYAVVESPTGSLRIAWGRAGVSLVDLASLPEAEFRATFAARYPGRPLRVANVAAPAAVLATLRGNKATVSYDLSACSPFQQAVLRKTSEIPRGEVRSYGWIAKEIGQDAAVRAVGTALGRNPIPILIPCHRVVRTDGHIGNYGLGPPLKHELLRIEGVDVDELTGLAAKGVRYVGTPTTHIFCVPTCQAARRIEPANRVLFRSAAEAATQGYRPCQRCRPAPMPAAAGTSTA